jgi:hypothetical protein
MEDSDRLSKPYRHRRREGIMHAVIRSYTGEGASEVFDLIEQRNEDVRTLISGVPGFISYTAVRTADGGVTVTVCEDQTGTDESSKRAAAWVKENSPMAVNPPSISQGSTVLHIGS